MALNIDGTLPVEIKQVDSIKITQTFIDSKNNRIVLTYEKKSEETILEMGQMIIEGANYAKLMQDNLELYTGVKASLYGYASTELNITGTVV